MRKIRHSCAAAAFVALAIAGCYGATPMHDTIVLHRFSDKNYVALDKNLRRYVCVTGRLKVDTIGVYFALQPIERSGLIDVGFSRINVELSDAKRPRSGEVRTVCGTLEDATPFEECEAKFCKWYKLAGARLEKKAASR